MENDHFKPAFPTNEANHFKDYSDPGMTLRDFFAAKAMQGWLSSYPESCTHPIVAGNADDVAKNSYMLADAMLRAREAS
ncbi:hypothetical protein RN333_08435 [Enterobacter kobei]|uniref:hypothetical protein n=1 Tax=Enterobacter kobei TaxID=208224 RepID=UPI0028D6C6CD|nr:hypothetical protein [Enterobacter kobei]WNP33619.1 hypothetical protein RN333_16220 [Enterobacter kobei]WNP36212.1 hypothetical protein RN333_08435 [Enterobacter kobei]